MGSDVPEAVQAPRNSSEVKAHSSMCWELTKILDRINCVLPAIELAQPGCLSGIKELCSLNNTIMKGNLLLQHCAESSKLYLAVTGEGTVLRCERIRTALYQSLCKIQNMVPQLLAAQVGEVVNFLIDAKFIIDSTEEEVGKAMQELLRQTESSEQMELDVFQIAALRLNITSPKALLIEKRSIKKLLDKIQGTDPKKERILSYFLYLLSKYGKKIIREGSEQKETASFQLMVSKTSSSNSDHGEAQHELSSAKVPPEEFCCPISSSLMYDPVVIASGQTYERKCIERWFNEGHDTCPKTQKRLEHLVMIPNTCMKDMISHWCRNHSVELCSQPILTTQPSWEPSLVCNSINSLKNVSAALLYGSSSDRILQHEHSYTSLSSNASYFSDASPVKEESEDNCARIFSWSDDYQKLQSFSNFSHDMFIKFFCDISRLPFELQGKAVDDVKAHLDDDEIWYSMLSSGFPEALVKFMKREKSDAQAQRIGAQILLSFLTNSRFIESTEGFHFLASFLDSEITKESLSVMKELTHHPVFKSWVKSFDISQITKSLDSEDIEFVGLALDVLYDISTQSEIKSCILSPECISRLVPLLSDKRVAESCIKTMRNLSDLEGAAAMISETDGCLASIVELLETESHEEQEHAVTILHSLCSRSLEYCRLVMKEGVIPSLVHISVNGNAEAKESSMKLLCLLRDMRHVDDCFDSLKHQPELKSNSDSREDFNDHLESSKDHCVKTKPTSKTSGFFRKRMRFFRKPVALS